MIPALDRPRDVASVYGKRYCSPIGAPTRGADGGNGLSGGAREIRAGVQEPGKRVQETKETGAEANGQGREQDAGPGRT